eukprot:Skav208237  [mRNA]  locus=scaffold2601:216493:236138:+ [translate_table: standard]
MVDRQEWTAQMCLHPLLKVPLTTMVARQAVATDPSKAAIEAMQALKNLAAAQLQGDELAGSWEAMDVQAWKNKQELERALVSLVEQPGRGGLVLGSMVDQIFVQEWVDFEVEMRHFFVEAISMTFQNDEAAMADAEKQAEELCGRWLQWLQARETAIADVEELLEELSRLTGRVEDLERQHASRVREAKASLEDLKETRG